LRQLLTALCRVCWSRVCINGAMLL
jgi:hypothetical protein